jgi:carbonic anhydrase/acetyltransferase-like protein (isoleucine patch superfamily)
VYCFFFFFPYQNRKSRWGNQSSTLKVKVLFIRNALSLGDVMREIDTLAIIKSDFVLVNGDVVGNLRLDSVVEAHRNRKLTDPKCILTMAVMKGSAFHRARATHDIFVLDPETSQCQQYIPMPLLQLTDASVSVIPDVLKICSDLDLHNDLIDCEVDVCTLDVLALFSENFDWQVMRSDFVRGILESEIIEKTIYAHFTLPEEYAVRVRNTQLYDCVSMDVVCRWTYPLVPESNFFGDTSLRRSDSNLYREPDVLFTSETSSESLNADLPSSGSSSDLLSSSINSTISNQPLIGYTSEQILSSVRKPVNFENSVFHGGDTSSYSKNSFSSTLKPKNVVIGRGTTLGPRVKLRSSVIGRECTIGQDSKLSHSYLWENVTVGEHCRISSAILSNNVEVGSWSIVEPGCLLGTGVRIGANVRLPAFSRIHYDGQNSGTVSYCLLSSLLKKGLSLLAFRLIASRRGWTGHAVGAYRR